LEPQANGKIHPGDDTDCYYRGLVRRLTNAFRTPASVQVRGDIDFGGF